MATLSSYLTDLQTILHDQNNNFWTQQELTNDINDARQRVCRDTGCLRTLQGSGVGQPLSTPIAAYNPYAGNSTNQTPATAWVANTAVTAGQYVFNNVFIYQYQTSGTSGSTAPAYPTQNNVFPPATAFADGTATLKYVQPAEQIQYASLPSGTQTLDVLNVTLYWGNSRIPLRNLNWTEFNAQLRYWQNYVGRPVCFSTYGQQTLYISPVPDQAYYIEVDTTLLPTPLTLSNPSAVDPINDPYTTPVVFYAAYKAKYKEQSYGEAEIYKQEYIKHIQAVLNSVFTRRIPDAYSYF